MKETDTRLSLLKKMARKVNLTKGNFIMPIIVNEMHRESSSNYLVTTPISAMISKVQKILDTGITKVMIFGIPGKRDISGSEAWNSRGIIQRALKKIKTNFGNRIEVSTDVCVCQYNLSGHCGTNNQLGTDIDNDASLFNIEAIARSHAEAGADLLSLSSMMDGQVSIVKNCLEENGFNKIKIISFAAKYASSLYSPFRTTAFSNFQLNSKINKSTYQVPCSNFHECLNEIQMDLNEGADIIMIKPSMGTLDLIAEVKRRFCCPLGVQNVSGEYAMIKAASDRGLINEDEWIFGYVIGMKRAGADLIMSYGLDRITRLLY